MMIRSEKVFKPKIVESRNFGVPKAKCDPRIVTPSPVSVVNAPSFTSLPPTAANGAGYESDGSELAELAELADSLSIGKEKVRSGRAFLPFPSNELERTDSRPIEHDKISNKRKLPDSGF